MIVERIHARTAGLVVMVFTAMNAIVVHRSLVRIVPISPIHVRICHVITMARATSQMIVFILRARVFAVLQVSFFLLFSPSLSLPLFLIH